MPRTITAIIAAVVLILLGLLIWHWTGADFRGMDLTGEEESPPVEDDVEIISTLEEPIQEREGITAAEPDTSKIERGGEAAAGGPGIVVSGKVVDDDTDLPIKAFTIIVMEKRESPKDEETSEKSGFVSGAFGEESSESSNDPESPKKVVKKIQDEDGLFTLQVTRGGRCRIWAEARGYTSSRREVVEVPPEMGLVGHVIRLKRTPEIEGRVVDDTTGAPVEGATVKWGRADLRRRTDEGKISRTTYGMGGTTKTDEHGCFKFSLYGDGIYVLTTTHPEFAAQSDDATAGAENVEIRLNRGCCIYGMVRNDNGRPAQGIQIRFKGDEAVEGGPYSTGPTGEYRTDPVKPCNVRIWASAPEVTNASPGPFTYEAYRVEIRNRDVEVNFGPSPDHVTWKGTFFGWDGDPVAKGRIRIWNDRIDEIEKKRMVESGASIHRTITCDGEGRFEIEKLIPGTFKIDMCPPGERMMLHHAALDEITFDHPGLYEVDLRYRRTELSGVVLDGKTRKPVEADYGFVTAYSQNRYYSQNLDGESKFCFQGLPPGTYSITAHAHEHASFNYGKVELAADQIMDDLEIVLPVNGELFVKVTGIEDIGKTIIDLEIQRPDKTPAWTVGPGQYLKDGMWAIRFQHEVGSWILVLKDATLGKIERPYEIRDGETTEIVVKVLEFSDNMD